MRYALSTSLLALLLLVGCGPARAPEAEKEVDPTTEDWYRDGVKQLKAAVLEAQTDFKSGNADVASRIIQASEPASEQLLAVIHPSLDAMQAAADLDTLYGQMLFHNHHYQWAEFMFQKNIARWKHWEPQTEETARRLKEAQDLVAQCDKEILKGPPHPAGTTGR